ncbi:uncharacterized protein LOC108094284 [Drosophila ficusphila]|uniref:uncharacterized protein LOC108094284 n=1 Tax=Drosophila ficusphila TaxID=30025 RepID=UPI0007E8147F|nr:uncharacterized protein LOC108094284 [Drosophila ficusphila]
MNHINSVAFEGLMERTNKSNEQQMELESSFGLVEITKEPVKKSDESNEGVQVIDGNPKLDTPKELIKKPDETEKEEQKKASGIATHTPSKMDTKPTSLSYFDFNKMAKLRALAFKETTPKWVTEKDRLMMVSLIVDEINGQLSDLIAKCERLQKKSEGKPIMLPIKLLPRYLRYRPPVVISSLIPSRKAPKLSKKKVRLVVKGQVKHRLCNCYVTVITRNPE